MEVPPLEHRTLRLDNGLRVVLAPRASALTTVWVRYGVGAGDDPPGLPGLAHLVEHLLFTGSKHTYGSDTSDHLYAARALGANGATSFAATDYYQSVPRQNLERVLWMESDRMGFMRGEVTREEVALARKVVGTELRIGDNDPHGGMFGRVHDRVFPPGHPYYDPPNAAALAGVSVETVEEFLRTYVVPANACLVLAGDLPEDVEELVGRYFGDLPGGTAPARKAVPPSPLAERVELRMRHPAAIIKIGWPSPPHRTPGDAAADLTATLLTANYGGGLWPEDGPIATLVAHQVSRGGCSLFAIDAMGRPGTRAAEVLAAIEAAISKVRQVGEEALAVARRIVAVEAIDRRGSTMGLAELIQGHMTAYGKADALAESLARYASIDAAGVAGLVEGTLLGGRRAVLLADEEGGVG